jgi:biotin carboxyl carrier protein
VTATPLGGGRFEVVAGTGRLVAYGVRRGHETWVFINGSVWVIDAKAEPSGRTRRHDDAALAAPMPATVVAINATPGQRVSAGDVLVVLEAMKMELVVTAPYDGRVTAVSCRVGELVQPGIALLELEP